MLLSVCPELILCHTTISAFDASLTGFLMLEQVDGNMHQKGKFSGS